MLVTVATEAVWRWAGLQARVMWTRTQCFCSGRADSWTSGMCSNTKTRWRSARCSPDRFTAWWFSQWAESYSTTTRPAGARVSTAATIYVMSVSQWENTSLYTLCTIYCMLCTIKLKCWKTGQCNKTNNNTLLCNLWETQLSMSILQLFIISK